MVERIQGWLQKDGAILVAIDFLDSAGGTDHSIPDEVCTDLLINEKAVAFFTVGADRPHMFRYTDIREDGDEVIIKADSNINIKVTPIWLDEQTQEAKEWAKAPWAVSLRQGLTEAFDGIQS